MTDKYIIANWKMNCLRKEAEELIKQIKVLKSNNKIVICPPFTLYETINREIKDSAIALGAQDCSTIENFAARTGEINVLMLEDFGCQYVIVGHSERRNFHNETNEFIIQKLKNILNNSLIPILCVGETFQEKIDNSTNNIIEKQLEVLASFSKKFILIAYEPIWSIGTGQVATLEIIDYMAKFISSYCKQKFALDVKILYGGSVNSENAQRILSLPEIGGVLVGSASLNSEQFVEICKIKG